MGAHGRCNNNAKAFTATVCQAVLRSLHRLIHLLFPMILKAYSIISFFAVQTREVKHKEIKYLAQNYASKKNPGSL